MRTLRIAQTLIAIAVLLATYVVSSAFEVKANAAAEAGTYHADIEREPITYQDVDR